MKAVQFRIARPTHNLKEIVKFYHEALVLDILGHFEDHLEFTQHIDKTPLPEPTKENLLVFYYDSPEEYQKANDRMRYMGILPVAPENPYWIGKGETYEDPDRWRVVLFNDVYR